MVMGPVRLCSESEVVDNSVQHFLVEGRLILLGKLAGRYYALDERCTHRGGPLSEGTLESGVITCPWHFGQFDIVTGEVRGPPPEEPLKTYGIRIEDANILISLP
jgi:nitrite reductase/ring-hydroxylating ferredoxin subunit